MKPEQKKSTSYKLKNKDWQKNTVKFFRDKCSNNAIDPTRAVILARAANGELQESDYKYITNPFEGAPGGAALKGYPAKMRNVDIIRTSLNRLLATKRDRNVPFQVIARNSDFPSKKSQFENELILKSLQQEFVNEMIKLGSYDGKQEPPMSPEVIAKQANSLQDNIAVMGQDFLDYAFDYNNIPFYFHKGFYDWLLFARAFSYKDIKHQDLSYEIVSALELSYMKSGDTEFIEDCEAVKRSKLYSSVEVDEMFAEFDDYDEEISKYVNGKGQGIGVAGSINPPFGSANYISEISHTNSTKDFGDTIYSNDPNILVEHVIFPTQTKVGKRIYLDESGVPQEDIVSEEYIPTEEEQVKWIWVTEKWEAYMIENKFIIGVKPLPYTRASINNPHKSKNPYNGRLMMSRYFDPISVVDILIPYQIKINIVYYFIEKVMAKNKDKITVMPLGLIPEKEGMDMLTTMYYADANGFLFVDDTNPNAREAMNAVKVIDASLDKYIVACYDIIRLIRQDADEAIGMTAQFKGSVSASSLKGTTQQAIGQTLLAFEELYAQYEEFEEKEVQGFLDLGKYCCVDGKKAAYISSDYKVKYLEIEPGAFSTVEFGVFAKRSKEEAEKLKMLKEWGTHMLQNGMTPSGAAKLMNANNVAKLVEELTEMERTMDEKQRKQAEAQQQLKQMEIEQREASEKRDDDTKNHKINTDYKLGRENKLDESEVRLMVQDKKTDAGKESAAQDFQRLALERDQHISANIEKAENLRLKDKDLNMKQQIENRRINVQEDGQKMQA